MRQITGGDVLAGLIAFFGLVAAVNGVFIYVATSTFSGPSTENAYSKGLAYNRTLQTFRAQQMTGWQVRVEMTGPTIRLTVTDAAGRPVHGLAVSGRIGRPATQAEDRTLAFLDAGQGRYQVASITLAPGQWELEAEARPLAGPESEPFKVTARLWVPLP